MRIGRSICELWEVRDSIYKVRPDLKRYFVKEREENKRRYDELDQFFKMHGTVNIVVIKKQRFHYIKNFLKNLKQAILPY
ncbi:MAG: hypothetical protein SVO01_10555 [Thermotogota bacterium]|nr:hypothetical protein [Thermotogota bacterium]